MGKRNAKREQANGMFEQFEPAPAAPAVEEVPLFDAPAPTTTAAPKDYGTPTAPRREAPTTCLFEVMLTLPDTDDPNTEWALTFGI